MEWQEDVLGLRDISRLYDEKAGEWLLLEILDTDANNNPEKWRLLAHNPQKEMLHDYLLEDTEWDWNKKYMIVLADPNQPCSIK